MLLLLVGFVAGAASVGAAIKIQAARDVPCAVQVCLENTDAAPWVEVHPGQWRVNIRHNGLDERCRVIGSELSVKEFRGKITGGFSETRDGNPFGRLHMPEHCDSLDQAKGKAWARAVTQAAKVTRLATR